MIPIHKKDAKAAKKRSAQAELDEALVKASKIAQAEQAKRAARPYGAGRMIRDAALLTGGTLVARAGLIVPGATMQVIGASKAIHGMKRRKAQKKAMKKREII